MRVLYIEDNRINALLFEEVLRMEPDTELRIAEDGAQALATVADWLPDLLVIDAHLPDVTGIDLLPRLRQLPGLDRVPAVMCSADSLPEDEALALAHGFVGYWVKPLDIPRLLTELRALRPRHG
jgi:CheY-like chemotaxis protein